MKKTPKLPTATLEDVLTTLDRVVQFQEESKQLFEEIRQMQKRTGLQMEETDRKIRQMQETDCQYKERRAESDKYERRMKKMEEMMGSWQNNHGSFAEEYFFNAFADDEMNFFGERFYEISKNLKPKKGKLEDDYDIVMYNGTSVAIVEIKYKAHENDIPLVLDKVRTFRILCPEYEDFKIYLGVATMSFHPEAEQNFVNQGIAVIKQVGDIVVIRDENMKVF